MDKNQNLLNQFLEYLKKEGYPKVTRQNYAVDLRHFLNFLKAKRTTRLSPQIFAEYRKFLTTTSLSLRSINRRLSSLRKFGQFLALSGAFSQNPTSKIKNITPLAKKIAEIKTKNFPQIKTVLFFIFGLSLTVFLLFTSPPFPKRQPLPPSPPKELEMKTLSFQGQLNDKKGQPRTGLTLATFRLWDQKFGGNQLYSSGYCFIKPNQNGIFNIVIGQDCGKKIPASFFSQYEKIYLEMEVEGEKPTPRTLVLNTNPILFTFEAQPTPTPPEREEEKSLEKILETLRGFEGGVPTKPMDIFEKEGRLTTGGDFEIEGKLIDAGLGIYGINKGKLPSTFDFTKGLTAEFDFESGNQDFEVILENEEGNAYYCSWEKLAGFSIGKIINGEKNEFLKVEKVWQEDAWFHGRIGLQQSILSCKIGESSVSSPLDLQSLPLTKTGTIKFAGDIKAFTNLRIFSGEKTLLAAGEAEVEKDLQVKGAVTANLSGEKSGNEVCWQGNMDAGRLVACSSGADLAEYFEAEEDVEEGDVVSIKYQKLKESSFLVGKSTRACDPNLIGVVSSLPWRVMGEKMSNAKPVALAGRVPVKVKGEIRLGDPLTSSEVPGVGQKAKEEGLIFGRALEPCLKDSCKILAFINISWYKPEPILESKILEASPENLPKVGKEEKTLTIPQDLTVLGKTSLAQTSIAGEFMVDGSLTLSQAGLSNLFGPLRLQSQSPGEVDILNGKVVIDKEGNLQIQGKILAQEIETQKLNVTKTAGSAVLPAGQSQLLIKNYGVTPNSLIFLTPLSSTFGQSLYVKIKNPGEGFTVGIDAPTSQDLPFNWLVVN